jgi:hypothetical protein
MAPLISNHPLRTFQLAAGGFPLACTREHRTEPECTFAYTYTRERACRPQHPRHLRRSALLHCLATSRRPRVAALGRCRALQSSFLHLFSTMESTRGPLLYLVLHRTHSCILASFSVLSFPQRANQNNKHSICAQSTASNNSPPAVAPLYFLSSFLSTATSKSRGLFLSEFSSHNLQFISTSICSRAATT